MPTMDDLDRRLISLLRANGREPVAQIAQRLGVTRATVNKRITRLIDTGVIIGFSAQVRDPTTSSAVRAITLIAIEGPTSRSVIRALRGIPEVAALHTTNGRWDIVAELSCESLAGLETALAALRSIEGIRNSETSILLSAATA